MTQRPSTSVVPSTTAELKALISRRDEIVAQLSQLSQRRSELSQELTNHRAREKVGDIGSSAPIENSIRVADERTVVLERERLEADDAIANAKGRGLSETMSLDPVK